MLVIDPEECIDCGVCVPECPIEAIVPDDEVPDDQQALIEINTRLSQQWPVITVQQDPPTDADKWKDVANKLQYLEE